MAGSPRKRARRERAAAAVDPLDEAGPRQPLSPIPWNKVELTDAERQAVAAALTQGYPRHQIAQAMGTTVKTLKRLIDDSEELLDAIEARKDAEEAELRDLLMGMARGGDTVAAIFLGKSQYGWRDRDDGKGQPVEGGGILFIPTHVPIDEWSAAAARQQKQYREVPEVELTFEAARTGSPGIEGLRLVKPGG